MLRHGNSDVEIERSTFNDDLIVSQKDANGKASNQFWVI